MVMGNSEQQSSAAGGEKQRPHQDPQQGGEHDQAISAIIPGRLAVQPSVDDFQEVLRQKWRERPQGVAARWQLTSAWAGFWEISLVPRVQYGRPHELAGLMASGGEQLALGLAATVEAQLWDVHRTKNPANIKIVEGGTITASQEMCQRAMADLASYYLLSAGHTVANVTARVLALDTQLHPTLLDSVGSWFPIESNEPKDWLTLNADTVRKLRRVARKSRMSSYQHITDPVTAILTSSNWRELDRLLGAHYHRLRPQSAGLAGVPSKNPWTFSNGVATMTDAVEYIDGNGLAKTATNLATSAISDLAVAMDDLHNAIESIIAELNSPLHPD